MRRTLLVISFLLFAWSPVHSDAAKFTTDKCEAGSQSGPIARRGCCSWHGGVCGCDEYRDRIICCDGTLSPSCTCSGY